MSDHGIKVDLQSDLKIVNEKENSNDINLN